MPASQVGLPTVLPSHRFAYVIIDKFTDSEVKDSTFRNLIGHANRYHHWQDMLRFKREDVLVYDFGGWYEGDTDQEKLSINRFKEEFRGMIVTNYNRATPK